MHVQVRVDKKKIRFKRDEEKNIHVLKHAMLDMWKEIIYFVDIAIRLLILILHTQNLVLFSSCSHGYKCKVSSSWGGL